MKTIIKIFLSFVIAISPIFLINSANASTVGGWSMGNPVAVGASTVYEGTKQLIIDGKNYIKTGTAKITPAASQVSKVLARGAAGAALSVAVQQLLGAVDWVLDPANNQIKYTETVKKTCASYADCAGYLNLWRSNTGRLYTTPDCITETGASGWWGTTQTVYKSETSVVCRGSSSGTELAYINRVVNPAYDPAAEKEQKTLPLDVVSAQVISNAEGNTDKKAAAQVATTAAAADIVAEAETDETKARPIADQLNKSASTKPADSDAAANAGTGTATATPQADPVTGEQAPPTDIALEFPIFCDWAPTICEAAQTVISSRDWFMSDDDLPENEKPQISEIPTPQLKEDAIRWSAQCPADAQVPINMQGVSSTITFSWSPWCQLLSMIKPAIIVSAYIGAAFIVLGLRT